MALASHTSSFYPYRVDVASAAARIQEDGSLIIHVGIHDHGCGTVMAMNEDRVRNHGDRSGED